MNTKIIYLVYGILFLAAVAYALILNTKAGKRFADHFTWASVVIGTALVMASAWFLVPAESWVKIALAFVVAGAPMIGRSLVRERRPHRHSHPKH